MTNSKPNYTKYQFTLNEFNTEVTKSNFSIPLGNMTDIYIFSDENGWHEVLYKLAESPLDAVPQTRTCVQYAENARLKCSTQYGLNAIGIAVGLHNGSGHAWNIFYTTGNNPRFIYFEPDIGMNAGWFEIGERGYVSNKIYI